MTTKHMIKATKVCPVCKSDHNHVMRKICTECGFVFYKKRKKRLKGVAVDWQELKRKDKVYIACNDYWEAPDGEIYDMGNTGKYIVHEVTAEGLVLYGKRGFVFQSMTKEGISPNGIVRSIPKIKKLRETERL